MKNKKAVRLAGFVGAVCATGALIGVGVSGTGAYFSDSSSGSVTGTTGHLKLATANSTVNFSGLNPGVNQTSQIAYAVDSTTPVDIWVVFDTTDVNYKLLTSYKGTPGTVSATNPDGGGLGRYGYFAINASDNAGGATAGFKTGNLSFANANNSAADNGCSTDAVTGVGGSSQVAQNKNDKTIPYCGIPGAIKVVSNVPGGDGGNINVTLGLNGPLWTAQNVNLPTVPFKVVATETGVIPNDPNNN